MLEYFMGRAILAGSSSRVVKHATRITSRQAGARGALLLLGLLASGLTLGAASSDADPTRPSPRVSLPRDGAIFIGSRPGDSTSSGQLILEKNFRQTRLLRWQSTDALLGRADSDFFQPRDWQIRDLPLQELTFMDRSPGPAMRGRVMLAAPNKALVEIVVSDEMSSYQLVRADIGLRFVDEASDVDAAELSRNSRRITSANFKAQKCHMRPLRISGPGSAVLDDSNDSIVALFDLQGQKLSLPAELKRLPIVLWVSGVQFGTTGLRVDYTLSDQATLEQEIAVRVRGEIAEGQGCPASAAEGAGK